MFINHGGLMVQVNWLNLKSEEREGRNFKKLTKESALTCDL